MEQIPQEAWEDRHEWCELSVEWHHESLGVLFVHGGDDGFDYCYRVEGRREEFEQGPGGEFRGGEKGSKDVPGGDKRRADLGTLVSIDI